MRPLDVANSWALAVYWAVIALWLLSEGSYFVRFVGRPGSRTQDRLAVLCFVLAWPGFAYRIRTEEAALASTLGEPYREYMRRTKRLIPFLL